MKVPDLSSLKSAAGTSGSASIITYQKPTIIRKFSFDKNRILGINVKAKQMTVPPSFYGDSNVFNGFSNVSSNGRLDWRLVLENSYTGKQPLLLAEHLELLLRMLKGGDGIPFSIKGDTIFCFRGILTLLLMTPLDRGKEWKIYIHRSKDDGHHHGYDDNSYFFCEGDPMNSFNDVSIPIKHRKMMYGGFKFESLLMSSLPSIKERQKEAVEINEEYNIIYQTKIGSHPLIFGAEVDGCKGGGPGAERMVELKTSSFHQSRHTLRDEFLNGNDFFVIKVIKWWLQSFLAGIDLLVIGWRDWNGRIVSIEEVQLFIIPKLLKEKYGANDCRWDLNSLFAWGDNLLSWIKDPSFMDKGSFITLHHKDGNITKIDDGSTPHFI